MPCNSCGQPCASSVCRDCLLLMAPDTKCVHCGVEIGSGYVSIKGRCIECHEAEPTQLLATFLQPQAQE